MCSQLTGHTSLADLGRYYLHSAQIVSHDINRLTGKLKYIKEEYWCKSQTSDLIFGMTEAQCCQIIQSWYSVLMHDPDLKIYMTSLPSLCVTIFKSDTLFDTDTQSQCCELHGSVLTTCMIYFTLMWVTWFSSCTLHDLGIIPLCHTIQHW